MWPHHSIQQRPGHHPASLTICLCFYSRLWLIKTWVCQHGKFHKNIDFGALSPDILGYEACGGTWELVLVKWDAVSLWNWVWEVLIRRTQYWEPQRFPQSDTTLCNYWYVLPGHLSKKKSWCLSQMLLGASRAPGKTANPEAFRYGRETFSTSPYASWVLPLKYF